MIRCDTCPYLAVHSFGDHCTNPYIKGKDKNILSSMKVGRYIDLKRDGAPSWCPSKKERETMFASVEKAAQAVKIQAAKEAKEDTIIILTAISKVAAEAAEALKETDDSALVQLKQDILSNLLELDMFNSEEKVYEVFRVVMEDLKTRNVEGAFKNAFYKCGFPFGSHGTAQYQKVKSAVQKAITNHFPGVEYFFNILEQEKIL